MKVISGIHAWRKPKKLVVVAMGMFDGVHRGHQKVIHAAKQLAHSLSGICSVLTFDMHPRTLLYPNQKTLMLSTYEERIELLRSQNVDRVLLLYFSHFMAEMKPDVFFEDILVKRIGASSIVVGKNFHFGNARTGEERLLKKLGKQYGLHVRIVSSVHCDNKPVSSTRIRSFLSKGKIREAAKCLGGNYSVTGAVIHGHALGRKHNVPTINVHLAPGKQVPSGVFAGYAAMSGREYPAVINIGTRPTIDESSHQIGVEAHLINFNREVYGRIVRISFVKKIRDEKRFKNIDVLFDHIQGDIECAKRILKM